MARTIVAVVEEEAASEAVFAAAMAELQEGDRLLIAFPRPVRQGGRHWEEAARTVTADFDRKAQRTLRKYSEKAAAAKVLFEAREVEGFHPEAALAATCRDVGADLVVRRAAQWSLFHGARSVGSNCCPNCNPFLRPGGLHGFPSSCEFKHGTPSFPCAVKEVRAGRGRTAKVGDEEGALGAE